MRLVFIRHGESQSQENRIVSGHDTCTGLSDRGREQARALRDRLLRTGELREATAVYTSLMQRAVETAETIAPAVGGLRASLHCHWCEQHPGEGEGLSWDEFDERYGVFDEGAARDVVRAPGSESVEMFVARIEQAVLDVTARHQQGETAVVVCHGGVIGCALEVLGGVPFGTLVRYVENTSITELIRADDGRWLLARLNDHAHLL